MRRNRILPYAPACRSTRRLLLGAAALGLALSMSSSPPGAGAQSPRPDPARPISSDLPSPTRPMNYLEKNGVRYVSSTDLEREGGIAVKPLPGQDHLVVCVDDRCALAKDYFLNDQGVACLSLAELESLLGAKASLDPSARTVRLEFAAREPGAPDATSAIRVGNLSPDIRLPRLDGGFIALSELRGKRVLINSWASW